MKENTIGSEVRSRRQPHGPLVLLVIELFLFSKPLRAEETTHSHKQARDPHAEHAHTASPPQETGVQPSMSESSTKMDMEHGDHEAEMTVTLSPEMLKRADIRRAPVEYRTLAKEIRAVLAPDQVGTETAAMDSDFQWAVAIAAFAEILKESPYAEPAWLTRIEEIVTAENWLDPDRSEFVTLFDKAVPLIATE